jgi:hypothetical protein
MSLDANLPSLNVCTEVRVSLNLQASEFCHTNYFCVQVAYFLGETGVLGHCNGCGVFRSSLLTNYVIYLIREILNATNETPESRNNKTGKAKSDVGVNKGVSLEMPPVPKKNNNFFLLLSESHVFLSIGFHTHHHHHHHQ